MAFYQVVASDVDGTLTSEGQLSAAAMDAINQVRLAGVQVVMVTGRIGSELYADFPHIGQGADALVLENGAVAVVGGQTETLATPVDRALDDELHRRGITFRRGEVLIATLSEHAAGVAEAVGVLGLDCQLIRNRQALMVLPAGVTKGTGLLSVLSHMNRSPHNVVAIGDAENDLSMMAVAELGVAVGNAVASVKSHADTTTDEPDGEGLARLLRGQILSGARRWCPTRHWIDIGSFDDGTATQLPGSQGRILVTGPSGSGKSHVIGLMAERWILAGYGVLVVDPEGDHTELKQLDNVLHVDSGHYLPEPSELLETLHPRTSLVVDLSSLELAEKIDYVQRLRAVAETHRESHGFPHWVVYDEAHLLGSELEPRWLRRGGYVLSSYAPALLPGDETDVSDVILAMNAENRDRPVLPPVLRATISSGDGELRPFTVSERRTVHIRHRHKYADMALPRELRFYFSTAGPTVAPAATIREFNDAVRRLDPKSLRYHLERGDFSRWLAHTVADTELADEMAAWEDELAAPRAAEVERIRGLIVHAIEERYLDDQGQH
ncbi:Sugar phosphatase YidA [Mycobacterium sp. THAF192]|nr:Sugar phosphatase YidA [Mycobacterium sp. THAF192]